MSETDFVYVHPNKSNRYNSGEKYEFKRTQTRNLSQCNSSKFILNFVSFNYIISLDIILFYLIIDIILPNSRTIGKK